MGRLLRAAGELKRRILDGITATLGFLLGSIIVKRKKFIVKTNENMEKIAEGEKIPEGEKITEGEISREKFSCQKCHKTFSKERNLKFHQLV